MDNKLTRFRYKRAYIRSKPNELVRIIEYIAHEYYKDFRDEMKKYGDLVKERCAQVEDGTMTFLDFNPMLSELDRALDKLKQCYKSPNMSIMNLYFNPNLPYNYTIARHKDFGTLYTTPAFKSDESEMRDDRVRYSYSAGYDHKNAVAYSLEEIRAKPSTGWELSSHLTSEFIMEIINQGFYCNVPILAKNAVITYEQLEQVSPGGTHGTLNKKQLFCANPNLTLEFVKTCKFSDLDLNAIVANPFLYDQTAYVLALARDRTTRRDRVTEHVGGRPSGTNLVVEDNAGVLPRDFAGVVARYLDYT
jgi:hypothetical protein